MSCVKILIADADRATAEDIGLQLARLGYTKVSIAASASEIIEKTHTCSPDLLLMDINLGSDVDGIETARIVMQKFRVPVIFLSARTDEETLDRAVDLHPMGFLSKPLRDTDLRTSISLALTRMKSNAVSAPKLIENVPYLWQVKVTSDLDGNVTRIHHGSKTILQQHGVGNIHDTFPGTHIDHLQACKTSNKPRLVFDRQSTHMLSLEYRPMHNSTINITITGWPIPDMNAGRGYPGQDVLLETIDHLTAGVILFNENLNIFYFNKSARSLLDRGDCLQNIHGYLACTNHEITAELKMMAADHKDHLLSIDRKDSRPSLNILLTPLNSCRDNIGKNLPTTIMFAFEVTDNYTRVEDVLRNLYHLSPMEARLVAQLFMTPNLTVAAAALGITLNTARTHLKRIYNKTRVNRISSLIHMIVTGPASIVLNTSK